MKRLVIHIDLCLILIIGLISFSVSAAEIKSPLCLTVELQDGSHIVGTNVEKNYKFHSTLLGDFKLSPQSIRLIESLSTNLVKLTTVNNDALNVSFIDPEFTIETSFGKVRLTTKSIRKIAVITDEHLSGLVGYWSGDNGGKNLVDGSSADLTDITFVDGKNGRAFSFNGASSSICVPASPSLDIGAGDGFTIMAWIKPSDVSGLHPLFQWLENDVISDKLELNLWIDIRPYENGALMACITDFTGNRFLVSHPGILSAGIFQHIALTYDKASNLATWYLNGVVVAHRKLSGHPASTKGNLWISHRDDRPGNWSTGRTYSGLMDKIAIYNRALSASEIQSICVNESHGEPLSQPSVSDGWYEEWMR